MVGAGTLTSVCGLGGLNYSRVSMCDFSDGEIGINLGAGVSFSQFYGEVKYDTAFEQVAITVGIIF